MSDEAPVDNEPPASDAPRLHCLGGGQVSEAILADWRIFESLPPSGQAGIWQILGPALVAGASEDLARVSTAFCEEHKIESDDLERALEACHFLLSQAASFALDEAQVRADLEALTPGGGPAVQALMSEYGQVSAFLRNRIVEASLLDHSRVLRGLDWRIDILGASQRGLHIDLPVGVLTLKHQQGIGDDAETGRITLHILPDGLAALKQACEQLEQMFASAKPR